MPSTVRDKSDSEDMCLPVDEMGLPVRLPGCLLPSTQGAFEATCIQRQAVGPGPNKKDRKTTVRKIILFNGPRATQAVSPTKGPDTGA